MKNLKDTRVFSKTMILGLIFGLAVMSGIVSASSHSEAPGIGLIPKMDCTDVYAFVSPDNPDTVTIIANYIPLEEPAAGPNFYRLDDDGIYDIDIINTLSDVSQDNIVYRFTFNTAVKTPDQILAYLPGSFGLEQSFTLTEIRGNSRRVVGSGNVVPPPNVGPKTTPNYPAFSQNGVYQFGDIKVFVGVRDDPFFIDLAAIFDAATIRKLPGNKGGGVDTIAGFNVHSIAIQVPITALTKNGSRPTDPNDPNAVIGVYSLSYLPKNRVQGPKGPTYSGPIVEVSRLGNPLVNELVIALKDKERWNSSKPKNDVQFLNYVIDPDLPKILNSLYGISIPPAPRNDLVAVFLTGVQGLNQAPNTQPAELMRLNVAIPPSKKPNRFGVIGGDLAGYPNGRRLADDIVDISLRVVAGVLVSGFNIAPNNQLGDGVDANDVPFQPDFPYLGFPQNPLTEKHDKKQPVTQ
jgi:Domain of unknown function (DUF4331)